MFLYRLLFTILILAAMGPVSFTFADDSKSNDFKTKSVENKTTESKSNENKLKESKLKDVKAKTLKTVSKQDESSSNLDHTNVSLDMDSKSNADVNPPSTSSKKRKHSGLWTCKNCFWIGGGAHYLVFQQKPPANLEPVNYQSIGAPSVWTQFRFKVWKRLGVTAEYQSQSGADLKTKSLNIKDPKVNWTYSTFGFDYRFRKYFRLFKKVWLPRVLFAYQSHSMPFIQQQEDSTYSISPLQFNSLSVGGYFDILSSESWHFFLTNRIQVPIQSQSKVQVKQGLSFDGTIGAVYHFTPMLSLALFWGGQYHSLKYQDGLDTGNYTLWNSKMNALLGFYF